MASRKSHNSARDGFGATPDPLNERSRAPKSKSRSEKPLVEVSGPLNKRSLHGGQDREKLKDELATRKLPREISDFLGVIDPSSIQAREAHNRLSQLRERLGYTEGILKNTTFLLYRSSISGAHYLQHSYPPIVLVSIGTFCGNDAVTSEDAVGFLVARALSQADLLSRYKSGASTQIGQGIAEFHAIDALHRAGFSAKVALQVIADEAHVSDGRLTSKQLEAFIHAGAEPNIRVLATYAGLVRVTTKYGLFKEEQTPLRDLEPIVSIASAIQLQSSEYDVLQRYGFHSLHDSERLEIIGRLVAASNDFSDNQLATWSRMLDLVEVLPQSDEENRDPTKPSSQSLSKRPSSKAIRGFITKISALLERGESSAFVELYQKIDKKWGTSKELFSSEIFDPLIEKCNDVLHSGTPERVLKTIEELRNYTLMCPGIGSAASALSSSVDFPSFEDVRGVLVPWEPHLNALKTASVNDARTITKLLLDLKIPDTRLFTTRPEVLWDVLFAKAGPAADALEFLTEPFLDAATNTFELNLQRFYYSYSKFLASKLEGESTREEAAQRLRYFETVDGIEHISELTESLGGPVGGIELLKFDPELFISLNRKSLQVPTLQSRLVKVLSDESMHQTQGRFLTALTESFVIKGELVSAGSTSTPLLDWVLSHKELEGEAKWGLLLSSGIFEKGYLVPRTPSEIEEFLRTTVRPLLREVLKLKNSSTVYPEEIADSWEDVADRMELLMRFGVKGSALIGDLEARVLLDDTQPTIAAVAKLSRHIPIYSATHSSLRDALLSKADARFRLDSNVNQALREWSILHRLNLYNSRDEAYRDLGALVERLDEVVDRGERLQLLEDVLLAPEGYSPDAIQIFETALVENLITTWCTLRAATFNKGTGEDDGTTDSVAEGTEIIDRLTALAPRAYLKFWFNTFAEKIKTQDSLNTYLQGVVNNIAEGLSTSSELLHSAGQKIGPLIQNSPFARRATMEMLLGPGDENTLRRYVVDVLEHLWREDEHARYKRDSNGTVSRQDLGPLNGDLLKWAQLAHRLFPTQSAEQKLLLVMQLLTPPVLSGDEDKKGALFEPADRDVREAVGMLLTHSLPSSGLQQTLGMPIRAYCDGLDLFERLSTVTLMLSCEQRRRVKGGGLGALFAMVCKEKGPLETWIAQTIQGNARVHPQLRHDMAAVDIKTNVQHTDRWDSVPQVRGALPPKDRKEVPWFGELLGSGKIWMTYAARSKKWGDEAIQIRHPNAISLIQAGVARWKKGLTSMHKRGIDISFFQALLPAAYKACITETKVELSKEQFECAARLLSGRHTEVHFGGKQLRYNYQIPRLISCGEGPNKLAYRRMTRLDGEHFIDLAKVGVAEDEIVMISASNLSMFISHLFEAISGFNMDPHGGNNRIKGSQIGCFDFGGMYLETPDSDSITQFCRIFFNTLFFRDHSLSLSEGLMSEVLRMQADKVGVSTFTGACIQSLLAMGEYFGPLMAHRNLLFGSVAGALQCQRTHEIVCKVCDDILGAKLPGETQVADNRGVFEECLKNPLVRVV